jgi:two-component system sensor histidine kinase DesK
MLSTLFRATPDSIAHRNAREGKMRYGMMFNLLWTIWVFGDVIFNHVGKDWMWATATSFPVFLLLYFYGYLQPQRHIFFYAAAMAALGYLVMPWNHSGGTSYVIYSCAYMAFFGKTPQSIAAMLAIVSAYVLFAYMQGWPWVIILSMSMVALSVGGGNLAYRLNAGKDAELRLSHEEVRKLAALAERERIGRDLHDLLGHTLSLITLKSELANRLFDRDPRAARREIADVERVARDALSQVRHAVTGIRAAGFAAELASAKLLLESNGTHLEYALADIELPPEIETVLALTMREATTNAQRHANASQVVVALENDAQMLVLRIADNGRGGLIVPGNGLTGMRERLAGIGAQLSIESQRGRGTTLVARMPLPQRSAIATVPAQLRTA